MDFSLDRFWVLWRRTLSLSWPIAIQQFLNTLMRTVDLLVTGVFSPAAVAAVGLADLYSDLPRQVGSAVGAGAIALASQDTGREAAETRDRAITQALILAFLAGVPFLVIGMVLSHFLIGILGATSDVVRLGGTYLLIVFAVAPLRIVGYVGAAALQGTGDTRTPMYINGLANALNIVATIGLGLGVGPLPALGIVGVGLATAISRTLEAVVMVAAIASPYTVPSLVRPNSPTISRQIVAIGVPRFGEQLSRSLASFPFNALLLLFGTEVVAGYHIARRIYQQFVGPVYRSFSTASSIIVGQTLGEADPGGARFAGYAIAVLTLSLMIPAGIVLFAIATPLSGLFTDQGPTIGYATGFTRTFAVSLFVFGLLFPFVGGLRGAGDTRTPFYAQFTAQVGFTLGFSYVTAIVLGWGLPGVYAGIFLAYVWRTAVVTLGFHRGDWAQRAASMMGERANVSD